MTTHPDRHDQTLRGAFQPRALTFQGKEPQVISTEIRSRPKVMLRGFKKEGVLDLEIDKLYDGLIYILTASYDFSNTLLKKNTTENHVEVAKTSKDKFVDLIQTLEILGGNVTVKGHIIDEHAIDCMKKCVA